MSIVVSLVSRAALCGEQASKLSSRRLAAVMALAVGNDVGGENEDVACLAKNPAAIARWCGVEVESSPPARGVSKPPERDRLRLSGRDCSCANRPGLFGSLPAPPPNSCLLGKTKLSWRSMGTAPAPRWGGRQESEHEPKRGGWLVVVAQSAMVPRSN